jgi:enoyl-CoA hydratase/carnithine racemase
LGTGLVLYERKEHIARIRLNRPEKLNAFSNELVEELRDAFFQFDDDESAWVAVLSGEGRAFCSGADVTKRMGAVPRTSGGPVLLSRFKHYKPVITAVHGYAYGGGLRLVLHSELSVADATARFQLTEVPRGFDASPLWAELRERGFGSFADYLAVTGNACGAEEAAAHGLITKAVPVGEHIEAAYKLAEQVLRNPPLAVRALVKARRSRLQVLESKLNSTRQESLTATNDFRESVAAWKEKRAPKFTGT